MKCQASNLQPAFSSYIFLLLRLQTGTLLNLSEQQIIDCSWGFGNRGCKGGYPHRAMQWVIKHGGLATDASYGRYLAQVKTEGVLLLKAPVKMGEKQVK